MRKHELKTVVVLGGFGHEGLQANLKSLGYEQVSLNLDNVTPRTWMKRAAVIKALNESKTLAATIIYLHTTLLLEASKPLYREAFRSILDSAQQSKLIIFVFQDNLDGIFSMRHWQSRKPMTLAELEDELDAADDDWASQRIQNAIKRLRDYEKRKDEVNDFIGMLYSCTAEVVPFFARADVTIRLQEFLADIEGGVFLRLFVPDDRFQAEQLKGLLSVLERYLRQVEGEEFSVDSHKSDKGTVYLFKSRGGVGDLRKIKQCIRKIRRFHEIVRRRPLTGRIHFDSERPQRSGGVVLC